MKRFFILSATAALGGTCSLACPKTGCVYP
jgi:hypothetical protein